MKNLYSFCAVLLLAAGPVFSQKTAFAPGECLVQLAPDYPAGQFLAALNRAGATEFSLKSSPSARWNIHLVAFDPDATDMATVLGEINRLPGVLAVQRNHLADDRVIPNDKEWIKQWNMSNIRAPRAWDTTTGGLSPRGDTIVVAVLEKGAYTQHPDLLPNLWFNWHETPNNGVDDDGNGYIDDFRGWNPRYENDSPGTVGAHGTQVNGIIGAAGNNALGIAGVNWKVKLMNLGDVAYESEIVAAYEYVAAMRRLYNETNGARGAFVVASNASFGLDNEFAADHPIWCAVYDSVGRAGVLSCGATANKDVNVDIAGDMPTTCPSEFFIAVTSTDNVGNKVASAGYGAVSIDLGAPGASVYSTTLSDGYAYISGTSIATPHVTGAIGLLYSLACDSVLQNALADPMGTARHVRDALLKSVVPSVSLATTSTTGGRLDLGGALDSACVKPREIDIELPRITLQPSIGGSGNVQVSCQVADLDKYSLRVFNAIGQLMVEYTFSPTEKTFSAIIEERYLTAAGMYLIALGRGKDVVAEKFLKL